MYNSIIPLSRVLLAGAVLVGVSACDNGGSTTTSFNLDPSPLPTNVVSNGGLENSNSELTGWSAYTGDDSTAEADFSVDSIESFRGNNSFKTSITALGDQPYHIEGGPVGVPVTAGKTYALVAWAKGTEGALANFTASMEEDPWTTFGNAQVSLTEDWEQVAFTFTLPEDFAASTIRLPVQMNFAENLGADIYIDDVQLVPTDPPSASRVNLVTNGSLEESDVGTTGGSATGWGAYANPAGSTNTTFLVNDMEAQEGEKSLMISVGALTDAANPWDIESGAVNVPVIEGETYTAIAWLKGPSPQKANVIVQMPGSPYYTFASQEVELTPEWQKVVFDVTITEADQIDNYEGPTTAVRLYTHTAYAGNGGAEIYVDNLQLYSYGDESVLNGDLEALDVGTTEIPGWNSNATENAPGTTFSVTDADAQQGSHSFHADIGVVASEAATWNVQVGPAAIPVVEGETYLVSAWLKGPDGGIADVIVQMPGSPYHTYANEEVTLTGDWQRVVFKAYISEASTIDNFEGPVGTVNFYVNMGYVENSSSDVYLDNFSFQKIEPQD